MLLGQYSRSRIVTTFDIFSSRHRVCTVKEGLFLLRGVMEPAVKSGGLGSPCDGILGQNASGYIIFLSNLLPKFKLVNVAKPLNVE
jgi:hypothetical protein